MSDQKHFVAPSLRPHHTSSVRRCRRLGSRPAGEGKSVQMQPLEVRRMLTLATHAVDASNTLQLIGSAGGESITVNKSGSNIVVTDVTGGTTTTFVFPVGSSAGQANKINIQAGGGSDAVLVTSNVKLSNGAGIPVTLAGNAGNDTLTSGPGSDVLSGGDGDDRMDGGVGNDVMTGGANIDTANYSNRPTALRVTLNNDADADGEIGIPENDKVGCEEVIGGAGNDTLIGSTFADFLGGGGGADSMSGGGGNDQLTGNAGSDKFFGESGNDFLLAQNSDQDTVNGGTNSDGTADADLASIDVIDVGGARVPLALADAVIGNGPGDLDASYGTGGKLVDVNRNWETLGAAIDSQGRAVFVGTVPGGDGYGSDIIVSRYTAAGARDQAFGVNGEVRVSFDDEYGNGYGFNATESGATEVVIGPGDSITVGGYAATFSESDRDIAVVRLTATGSLDTTLDGNGRVAIDLTGLVGNGYGIHAGSEPVLALQADGKLLIADEWSEFASESGGLALVRLLPNGDLDADGDFPGSGFNETGVVDLSFNIDGDRFATVNAIALQAVAGEQRIVLAGTSQNQFATLARLEADGGLDETFGGAADAGGIAGFRFEELGDASEYFALAVGPGNEIYAAGSASVEDIIARAAQPPGVGTYAVVTKYDANASADPLAAYYAPTGESGAAAFNALALDGAGRLLAAGADSGDGLLARFTAATLAPDTTFTPTGAVTEDFAGSSDYLTEVAVLPSGKIWVAAESIDPELSTDPIAARFNGNLASEPTPPNNEAEVTEVEGYVTYDEIHQVPPSPRLQPYFDNLSPSSLLYVLSQPDGDGVARIELGAEDNTVVLSLARGGDKAKLLAVSIDGLVIYYDVDTTTRIEIHGNAGNDRFTIDGNIKADLLIDGGAGNDTVAGAAGNDVLLGGAGNDVVSAGQGLDIVIGGAGADQLNGTPKEDLIIAGTTVHDGNVAALLALSAEWASGKSIAGRINALRNGGGLNGPVVLRGSNAGAGQTVFDDAAIDRINGNGAKDWLFVRQTGSNADVLLGGGGGQTIEVI